MAYMSAVTSCDTFVALPAVTKRKGLVFGKNSDRPADEVQEVVYIPAANHDQDTKVQVNLLMYNISIGT